MRRPGSHGAVPGVLEAHRSPGPPHSLPTEPSAHAQPWSATTARGRGEAGREDGSVTWTSIQKLPISPLTPPSPLAREPSSNRASPSPTARGAPGGEWVNNWPEAWLPDSPCTSRGLTAPGATQPLRNLKPGNRVPAPVPGPVHPANIPQPGFECRSSSTGSIASHSLVGARTGEMPGSTLRPIQELRPRKQNALQDAGFLVPC